MGRNLEDPQTRSCRIEGCRANTQQTLRFSSPSYSSWLRGLSASHDGEYHGDARVCSAVRPPQNQQCCLVALACTSSSRRRNSQLEHQKRTRSFCDGHSGILLVIGFDEMSRVGIQLNRIHAARGLYDCSGQVGASLWQKLSIIIDMVYYIARISAWTAFSEMATAQGHNNVNSSFLRSIISKQGVSAFLNASHDHDV